MGKGSNRLTTSKECKASRLHATHSPSAALSQTPAISCLHLSPPDLTVIASMVQQSKLFYCGSNSHQYNHVCIEKLVDTKAAA